MEYKMSERDLALLQELQKKREKAQKQLEQLLPSSGISQQICYLEDELEKIDGEYKPLREKWERQQRMNELLRFIKREQGIDYSVKKLVVSACPYCISEEGFNELRKKVLENWVKINRSEIYSEVERIRKDVDRHWKAEGIENMRAEAERHAWRIIEKAIYGR